MFWWMWGWNCTVWPDLARCDLSCAYTNNSCLLGHGGCKHRGTDTPQCPHNPQGRQENRDRSQGSPTCPCSTDNETKKKTTSVTLKSLVVLRGLLLPCDFQSIPEKILYLVSNCKKLQLKIRICAKIVPLARAHFGFVPNTLNWRTASNVSWGDVHQKETLG